MSKAMKTAWLKDKNGETIAPKTYTSQVLEYGDTPLDEKLRKIDKELKKVENAVASPLTAEIGQQLIVKEVDENGKPIDWDYVDRPCYLEEKEVLFDGTIDLEEDNNVSYYDIISYGYSYYFPKSIDLVIGQTYLVFWNNKDVYIGIYEYHDSDAYIDITELIGDNGGGGIYKDRIEIFACINTRHNLRIVECDIKVIDTNLLPDINKLIGNSGNGYSNRVLKSNSDGTTYWSNDYVLPTRYANSSQAGLVRTNNAYGTQMNGQYIQTYPATQSDITSKTHNYRPIVPKQLDYAVKAGLGNSKVTWTDTEKKNARNLIGAIDINDLTIESTLNKELEFFSEEVTFSFNNYLSLYAAGITGNILDNGNNGNIFNNYPEGTIFRLVIGENEYNPILYADYAGNGYLYNAELENTNEDWVLIYDGYDTAVLLSTTDLGTCTVKIYVQGEVTINKFDEKYIPDNIPRIDTASVGQLIEVEEVDDNGMPTKWRSVDKIQADMSQKITNAPDYVKNKLVYDYPMSVENGESEYYECNFIETPVYGITVIKDLSSVPSLVLEHYTYDYNCNINSNPYMKITYTMASYGITVGVDISKTSSLYTAIDSVNAKISIPNTTHGVYIYWITDMSVLTDEYKELFSSPGIYLQVTNEKYDGTFAPITNIRIQFHKYSSLGKRYLPVNFVKEVEAKITSPTTATVGQILEVESVDESGKPTSWKTTDLPEISGEDGFSPIATVSQNDSGATISIQDKNGTTTASIYHGENGKDGKTPYIDEEGFVVCGETPKNKTLIGEVVAPSSGIKIQPLSIDYATGIITVDDCSFLPDNIMTGYATKICLRKKTDKIYRLNTTPKEIDNFQFIGVKKLSENTLYLVNGTSEITSYTEDVENHDINSWWIDYYPSPTKSLEIDLSQMENLKELEIEYVLSDSYSAGCDICYYDLENNYYGETRAVSSSRNTVGLSVDGTRYKTLYTVNIGFPFIVRHRIKIEEFINIDSDVSYIAASKIGDRHLLPNSYKIHSNILMVNNGIGRISFKGLNYGMLPEGSYIKVWEVHD